MRDCRGGEQRAGYDDPDHELASTPPPGTVTELGRFALPDGRAAFWLGVGAGAPSALQEERGFLVIAHADNVDLAVDAVGPWTNTIGAERSLGTERIAGREILVERRRFAGTGAGTSSEGAQIWRADDAGHLALAGRYVTSAFDNRAFDLPLGKCGWWGTLSATLTYGANATISEEVTWDRKTADGKPCPSAPGHKVVRTRRAISWQDGRLVEAPTRSKENPLEESSPP
jgi:hypothetical protein